MKNIALAATFACLMALSAFGQDIQSVSITERSKSIEVTWATAAPADSSITVGLQSVSDDHLTTSHLLTVSNLEPETVYEISISSTAPGGTATHQTTAQTRELNAGLITRYGPAFVQAMAELTGPVDEEALGPQTSRLLVLCDLIGARRMLAEADEELARCDARLAKLQALQQELAEGNVGENASDAIQAEVFKIMDVVPEMNADDLLLVLQLQIKQQIKQLQSNREGYVQERDVLQAESDALLATLGTPAP